jgi:hypothetical protein
MHTSENSLAVLPLPRHLARRFGRLRRVLLPLSCSLFLGLLWLGSSAVPAAQQAWIGLDSVARSHAWDFAGWELTNIGSKLRTQIEQPAASLAPEQQAALVRTYLARAQAIGQAESRLDELYAQPPAGVEAAGDEKARLSAAELRLRPQLEARLAVLYEQQALVRPAVEEVLQAQVSTVLAQQELGLGWKPFPPVWFTFTEPPRKLVVSPRDRIETTYYAMLQPHLPPDERERIETEILAGHDLSAYVTYIGGLGAYPTIVMDQAPLGWVLSTIAHEWIHNYLTLFPLGINYGKSPELTILNETVADIAGDELGAEALAAFYPELVREFPGKDQPAPLSSGGAEEPFDFRKEMRHTREVVDLFLQYGRVADAEEYMQIRRQLFEENGYGIRKLNQAYFAFHGSYGTGAAATSPIGPKLEQLRALSPDLRTFLDTVRWFTSEADLDAALAQHGAGS